MSTYIVTGGAGFIGGHLAEALLKDGHTVRIIDNFSTGKRSNVPEGAELHEVDFTNLEAIKPLFDGVDGVFHMGAMPRIPLSIEQPVETARVNVMGTLNVLEAARHAGVKRVVYSASSSAYGDQNALPMRPDMVPNPLNPYALHKYVGEKFAEQFARFYGMQTVSLRYFNVYGPRMADEGAYVTVMAIFLRQKAAGKPMTIMGDGTQTRDFTHVSDVVRANMLAMASDKVGKGEVLNVGAGEQHAINEIAEAFGGEHVFIPERPGEMRHTLADTSRTKEKLGWEPQVKFHDGIRDLLQRHGF